MFSIISDSPRWVCASNANDKIVLRYNTPHNIESQHKDNINMFVYFSVDPYIVEMKHNAHGINPQTIKSIIRITNDPDPNTMIIRGQAVTPDFCTIINNLINGSIEEGIETKSVLGDVQLLTTLKFTFDTSECVARTMVHYEETHETTCTIGEIVFSLDVASILI